MKCRLKEISKAYNGRIVLDKVSYDFSKNGMYVLYGKSGIGKTTLLNIISGYEKADNGILEIESNPVYALQNYELLDSLNISDNLSACKSYHPHTFLNPDEYMKYLKVDHLCKQYPYELSKGQKQRIMVIKALCRKANIYLFDEPTSALDKESAQLVINLLYEKAKTAAVIVVTHDLTHIKKEKSTILELQKGKLIEINHSETENAFNTEIIETDENFSPEAYSIIKRIYKKQNRKTMIYYLLFSLIIITMIFINVNQYQWKVYNDLYEPEYLYIKETSQYDRTAKDNDSIINFLDFDTGLTTFPIHAVPSHHDSDKALLKDGGILINQNTAKFFMEYWGVKEADLIGKTFHLEFVYGVSKKQIDFEIRKVIIEQDARTSAMAYYDKNDLKNRIAYYDDIDTILYEQKVDASYIETVYGEKAGKHIEVFHPMLSDKYELTKQGSSESIILWLFIAIMYLFYILFITIMQRNNWKYHLTSNIIVINDGISCETVRNIYHKAADIPMMIVTAIALFTCFIAYMKDNEYIYLIAAFFMLFAYVVNRLCIDKNMKILRKHHISNLLKESQDLK